MGWGFNEVGQQVHAAVMFSSYIAYLYMSYLVLSYSQLSSGIVVVLILVPTSSPFFNYIPMFLYIKYIELLLTSLFFMLMMHLIHKC